MKQLNIALLYGGKSGEHQVSKESATSVIRNFDPDAYRLLLIAIDEQGVWYLQDEHMVQNVRRGQAIDILTNTPVSAIPGSGLWANGNRLDIDLVFPVLHGTNGEDGTVQGFLEILDIPYAGSDVLTSALGMDKIRAKQMWDRAGIPVVPFVELNRSQVEQGDSAAIFSRISDKLGLPFFIKPCRAGSSVGITKVKSPDGFAEALEDALKFDHRLLFETAVDAREIECSVLGYEDIVSFPPGEVISHHEFYDYNGKYIDPDGATLEFPAKLDDDMAAEIRRIAEEAFRAVGGDGLARVDFFIDRKTGGLFLNEINTMPGFTSISMYPKMCETGGLSYRELLDKMVELGLERHRRTSRLNLHYDA